MNLHLSGGALAYAMVRNQLHCAHIHHIGAPQKHPAANAPRARFRRWKSLTSTLRDRARDAGYRAIPAPAFFSEGPEKTRKLYSLLSLFCLLSLLSLFGFLGGALLGDFLYGLFGCLLSGLFCALSCHSEPSFVYETNNS